MPSVFGGHLYIHKGVPLREENGSYAQCLLVKSGKDLRPIARHIDPLPPMPCDLDMFRLMIMFTLCFTMGNADSPRGGDNAESDLAEAHTFWPHSGALPTQITCTTHRKPKLGSTE